MGLKIFASMLNASTSQSGGSSGEPVFQGVYYVSLTGTGNGFTSSTPMSVSTFSSLILPDNTIVRFFSNEVI